MSSSSAIYGPIPRKSNKLPILGYNKFGLLLPTLSDKTNFNSSKKININSESLMLTGYKESLPPSTYHTENSFGVDRNNDYSFLKDIKMQNVNEVNHSLEGIHD